MEKKDKLVAVVHENIRAMKARFEEQVKQIDKLIEVADEAGLSTDDLSNMINARMISFKNSVDIRVGHIDKWKDYKLSDPVEKITVKM